MFTRCHFFFSCTLKGFIESHDLTQRITLEGNPITYINLHLRDNSTLALSKDVLTEDVAFLSVDSGAPNEILLNTAF